MAAEIPVCTPVSLPAELQFAAAASAVRENPANAPMFAVAGDLPILPPEHIAVLTGRYWGPDPAAPGRPRRFTVGFLDNPDAATRRLILAHANAWAEHAYIEFVESSVSPLIRIDRGPGGYYSYLGTDNEHIPADQQTMNLEGFTARTSDAEYRRVVRHEFGHCLVGDTRIDCPRDLEKYPTGIPIRELVGQEPWVYAWSGGTLVIRKASRVWLSKRSAPIVRVTLRKGSGRKPNTYLPPLELVGTPDHPVLLSDGVMWKNLGDLQPGDRLCSMYRQSNGARSTINWTGQPDRIREHVFVCDAVYGLRPDGHDAHHINERMLDQRPNNLEWKEESAHHRDHSIGRRDSPETTAKRVAASLGRTHTDETRAKMSRSQRAKLPASAETRAKISSATKGKKQSAELVARRTEAMKQFYAAGGRSGMFGKTASDETRAKQSASMKATFARKREATVNHIVVSVEPAGVADVYDMTVPDANCFVANGVVVHNSLGCPHEHMRRELIARLDRAKVYVHFRRTQGWSREAVDQQVLTPLDDRSILGTPPDQTSIMCYQLGGEITIDGRPIIGGTDINSSDAGFMARIFPGRTSMAARTATVVETT
jgi:hypothetical protein